MFQAGPRSFVLLPRGIPHHFTTDAGPVTVLLIATPGGIEAYFLERGATVDEQSRQRVRASYGILRAGPGPGSGVPEPGSRS